MTAVGQAGDALRKWNWQHRPLLTHQQSRQRVLRRLSDIIVELYPCSRLYIHGSIAQTVSTHSSDLDICVVMGAAVDVAVTDAVAAIRNRIQKRTGLRVLALRHCRVPIVKFVGNTQVPPFDIGFDFRSVRNSALIRSYVNQDRALMVPLIRVFIAWSKATGINNKGCFSSYALTLMLLHRAVKHGVLRHVNVDECLTQQPDAFPTDVLDVEEPLLQDVPPDRLAAELLGTLQYYATWDPSTMWVQIDTPPDTAPIERPPAMLADVVCIRDPIDRLFNPASRVTNNMWQHASRSFADAARLLVADPLGVLTGCPTADITENGMPVSCGKKTAMAH